MQQRDGVDATAVAKHQPKQQRLERREEARVEDEPLRDVAAQHAEDHLQKRPQLGRVVEGVAHEADPAQARGEAEQQSVDRQQVLVEAEGDRNVLQRAREQLGHPMLEDVKPGPVQPAHGRHVPHQQEERDEERQHVCSIANNGRHIPDGHGNHAEVQDDRTRVVALDQRTQREGLRDQRHKVERRKVDEDRAGEAIPLATDHRPQRLNVEQIRLLVALDLLQDGLAPLLWLLRLSVVLLADSAERRESGVPFLGLAQELCLLDALDLIQRHLDALDGPKRPQHLVRRLHRRLHHFLRARLRREQQRRLILKVDTKGVGAHLAQVAIHLGLLVQHETVQNGVAAVHVLLHLWPLPLPILDAELRLGTVVAPVWIGAAVLVGEQILDDRLVVQACGEAEQRPTKVQLAVAVEEVAAGAGVDVGAILDE